jgi:hypothetical protein
MHRLVRPDAGAKAVRRSPRKVFLTQSWLLTHLPEVLHSRPSLWTLRPRSAVIALQETTAGVRAGGEMANYGAVQPVCRTHITNG